MGGSHSRNDVRFDGHVAPRWPAVADAIGTFLPVVPPAVCQGFEELRAINTAAFVRVADDGLVGLAASTDALRLTVRLGTPREAPLDLAAVTAARLPNVHTVTLEGVGRPAWSTVMSRPENDYVDGYPVRDRHVAAVITAALVLCPRVRSLVLRRCVLYADAYTALAGALTRLDAVTFDDVYWHYAGFDAFGSALRTATLRTLSGAFLEDRRFGPSLPINRLERMRLMDVRVAVLYDHQFWQWMADAAPLHWAIHYLPGFTGDLLPRTARVGARPAEAGFLDFGRLRDHCPAIHSEDPHVLDDVALLPPPRRLYVCLPKTSYRTNNVHAGAVVNAALALNADDVELLMLDAGVPYPVHGMSRDALTNAAKRAFQTVVRQWVDGPMTLCLVLRLLDNDVPNGTGLQDCQSLLWSSLTGGDGSAPHSSSLWLLPVMVGEDGVASRRCLDRAHQRAVDHVRRVFGPVVLPLPPDLCATDCDPS